MTDWPRWRLKFLVRINESVLPESTDPDYELRYLDISSVGTGQLEAEPELLRFEVAPTRARRLVRPGDTIVSTVRTYLRSIWPVHGDTTDLVVSTGFAVLSPTERLHADFLGWWAQGDHFVDEVVARSVGVAYPAINALEIGDIEIRLPPLPTQESIAEYLDDETERIDQLVALLGGGSSSQAGSMAGLLLERRQALITRTVTGQIQIPGVAA